MGKQSTSGFTIVELVVVIVTLSVLAAITFSYAVPKYRERTYYTRAISELNTMGNALTIYLAKYNNYPPDAVRDVPTGIKEFIQSGGLNDSWPQAPWPNTVYDWDNWPPDNYGPEHTYQISIRFCDIGDTPTCKARAKKYLDKYVSDSVLNSWDSQSAVFYCVKGSCRSHQSRPINHPGFCINCGNKSNIF